MHEMRRRKSTPQQLLRFIDSLEPDVATRVRDLIGSLEPQVTTRLRPSGVRRATYAAGGLALLTAASAGLSSLRDRLET
jgi:hypothetical protein